MNTHRTTTDLNFRRTPDGAVIRVLPKGTELREGGREGTWSRVAVGAELGWCATRYLEPLTAPAAAPAARPYVQTLKPLSLAQREAALGKIEWVHAPTPTDREHIRVTNGFTRENVVEAIVPQLVTAGVSTTGRCWVHRRVRDQLLGVFAAWEEAGLLGRVKSWGGVHNARLIRGSTTTLSNHAHGAAFDINMAWNPLNAAPAAAGTHGSVRELVPLANQWGWYWGGDFSRRDGMHFEIADVRG